MHCNYEQWHIIFLTLRTTPNRRYVKVAVEKSELRLSVPRFAHYANTSIDPLLVKKRLRIFLHVRFPTSELRHFATCSTKLIRPFRITERFHFTRISDLREFRVTVWLLCVAISRFLKSVIICVLNINSFAILDLITCNEWISKFIVLFSEIDEIDMYVYKFICIELLFYNIFSCLCAFYCQYVNFEIDWLYFRKFEKTNITKHFDYLISFYVCISLSNIKMINI